MIALILTDMQSRTFFLIIESGQQDKRKGDDRFRSSIQKVNFFENKRRLRYPNFRLFNIEHKIMSRFCLQMLHCFSVLDQTDRCTWWLMTKTLITLFFVFFSLFILFPWSTHSKPSSDLSPTIMTKSSSSLTTFRKPNITILMMFPDIDQFIPNLQSLLVVYEYVVHRYEISKWLNVNLQVKDSNCSISVAPYVLVTTMLSRIPDVVFGPFCGSNEID